MAAEVRNNMVTPKEFLHTVMVWNSFRIQIFLRIEFEFVAEAP